MEYVVWVLLTGSVLVQGQVPSPPQNLNVAMEQLNPALINVTWEQPQEPNGLVRNYRLTWGRPGQPQKEKITSSTWYWFVTESLVKDSEYEFRVAAMNSIGYGDDAVKTLNVPTVPAVPQNLLLSLHQRDRSKVKITWQQPLEFHGPIRNYRVSWGNLGEHHEEIVSAEKLSFVSGTLRKGRVYYVRVAAMNDFGCGKEVERKIRVPALEQTLYLSQKTHLAQISLDTADYTHQVLPLMDVQHTVAVDFDPVDGYIYWTDIKSKTINRAFPDGTDQVTLVSTEIDRPDDIAVDWIGRNLLWLDTGRERIEAVHLNGTFRRLLIADEVEKPRAIVLDPVAGLLFWTNSGKHPKIERSNLDGTDRIVLINTGVGWPNGLALDTTTKRIYWGDAKTDSIEMATYNGDSRTVLVKRVLSPIFGLTVAGDFVYWSDWTNGLIERFNKFTGGDRTQIIELKDVMGLKAISLEKAKAPSPPVNVSASIIHKDPARVKVTWEPPHEPNGLVKVYKVTWGQEARCHQEKIVSSERLWVVTGPLNIGKIYDFHVSALNDVGYGDYTVTKMATHIVTNQCENDNGGCSHLCLTSKEEPFYTCACPVGYRLLEDRNTCAVINPCENDNGGCSHLCLTSTEEPFYACTCPVGYTLLEDRETCVEVLSPCENDNGGCSHLCLASEKEPFYVCTCPDGYRLLEDRNTCAVLNPCENDNGGCSHLCLTSTEEPFYACTCPVGYTLLEDRETCAEAINPCENNNGGCSHLCLTSTEEPFYTCACPRGFNLLDDKITCANTPPLLLFSNRKDIKFIDPEDPENSSNIVISDVKDAAAVDFIYSEGAIFWTDVNLEVIKRVNLNNSEHSINIVDTGLGSPDGLACDWLGLKLYWTDSEASRIEVSNLDGKYRKVLFWEGLDKPRAIALDPANGYMYWTDWGENPKIERAGMDGSHGTRTEIITDNIFWPNGLTLDYDDSKIYWADAKLSFIHRCEFDGSNRQEVIAGELPHPFALTLYQKTLYWTDWQTRSIHKCNKEVGQQQSVVRDNLYGPMGIKVYAANRQLGAVNPCGNNNGGCSHLCLISPKEPFYTCACPTGIRLLEDKETCPDAVAEKNIYFSRRTDLRRVSLDTQDYTAVVLPLDDIRHAVAIDFDAVEGLIYWTDHEVGKISRARSDGSNQEVVVSKEVDHPDGIAVDWIGRNLYWTDTGTDRIEVARLNGSSRKVIVTDGLNEPRALAVDPISGYMFWTDWGEKPKIERANLDGTGRVLLISTGLGWPNGLALDLTTKLMYWGDAKTDRIEKTTYNGTYRAVIVKDNLSHIFGFSLLGDYLYWSDWQQRSIQRVDKLTGKNRTTLVAGVPDLMGLKAASKQKIEGTNACAEHNGNCSHLCLYRPNGRICACPMKLQLNSSGRTCVVQEAFLLFNRDTEIIRMSLHSNVSHQRILLKGVKKVTRIALDVNDNRIYWIDVDEKSISTAFLNGSEQKSIIGLYLGQPESMAVDWVAHNIYWADTGKNTIEMARLDGSSRKVLIWRELDSPRALAIDPPNGYLYVIVGRKSRRLERAHLDGTKRETLIAKIGRVEDLTIDYGERQLYWANPDKNAIESSDMLGKNRRTIVGDRPHPMRLTVYQQFVYWTDFVLRTIERADKISGKNHTTIQTEAQPVRDILLFHASRQDGWNSCAFKNGGCSHLCISHPRNSNTSNTSHHCSCPTHYTLNTDNQTCSAPDSFLLLAQRTSISRLVENVTDEPSIMPLTHSMRSIKALAFDPVDKYIYLINDHAKDIRRFKYMESGLEVVVSNEKKFRPYDLAVDPYSRTIYWTSNGAINVTRFNKSPIGAIISESGFKPRAIVLHPEKGYMYWTNMLSHARIEKAVMDGTKRSILFSFVRGRPSSLAIDKKSQQLFWADQQLKQIESSNLDGGNRKVLLGSLGGGLKFRGIAASGDFLYWLNKHNNAIERINKMNGENRGHVLGSVNDLRDVIAVELVLEVKNHPCTDNNGGCSDICFFQDGENGRCSCPLNLELKSDSKTCTNAPTCQPNQFTCKSGAVRCIPEVWRCDSMSECEDGSDEEHCST